MVLALLLLSAAADISTATLAEPGVKTPEVSTQELREILANRSATVLDSRPRAEYAVSHIPAVFIDVRSPEEFAKGSVQGAKNIPRPLVLQGTDVGELKKAKDDGRLPMTDHNARIIVFADSPEDARFVADQIAREAFHNVAYFPGAVRDLQDSIR